MSLVEKLEVLKRPGASEDELIDAIQYLGDEGDSSLHPHVAPFLADPRPWVRDMAVSVLGFDWRLPEYKNRFEEMMLTDPGEYVRSGAAAVLGSVLEGTRDKVSARLLITKVKDGSECSMVRQSAYKALLEIWAPDRAREHSRSLSDLTHEHTRLYEMAREARKKGDKKTDSILFAEAEEAWKRWIDWQLVDAIEKEVGSD
jgi:HEAT repeat protein